MKRGLQILLLVGVCVVSARARESVLLDEGWKFYQGDAPGAEQPDFDDTKWPLVDVPHDWSIAGPFAETNITGGAGGFLPSGVAWYRKDLVLSEQDLKQRVSVEFDGVMQNSDVWINGHHLGDRPNGYVSFSYDLTPYLKHGTNVLTVRCDTSAQPASRWYSGAGIYRHVRLRGTGSVLMSPYGVVVTTPRISPAETEVSVKTTVLNLSKEASPVTVETTLIKPDGKAVATAKTTLTLAVGMTNDVRQAFLFSKPQLWDLKSPKLYRLESRVISGKAVLDKTVTTFGIRDAKFTPEHGFVLNGKKVMLKGVCLHHDGGAFGAAVPLGIWEDRLTTLRSLGVNAIRCAHNPPAPEFLDLCDRMGFLVMDEFFDCWKVAKKAHDYHLFFNEWSQRDAADTIRRDRNHPSVILWSIGNEILDTPKEDHGIPIARDLVEVCHEYDPTRPATQALFRPNRSGDYTNGLADLLDVIGTNYRDQELLAAQRAKPERKIVNTEQKHDREAWLTLRNNPSLAGQFLWVGVDYLGEARSWPRVSYAGGLLDRTGLIKPMAYERQSWWSDEPMVRIVRRIAPNDPMPGDPGFGEKEMFTQVQFADWTPRDLSPHDETVEAYFNCEEVELFLNGRSLGVKKINADASPRVWKVPFAPGTLKAVARNGRKTMATDELRTAGKPVAIKLETRSSKLGNSWDDVAIVRATIVDAHGVVVPRAEDLVSFSLTGPGVIAAVDNGDNDSHELFQVKQRHAYHGTCTAFIKASGQSGKIKVSANANGLKPATATLRLSTGSQFK